MVDTQVQETGVDHVAQRIVGSALGMFDLLVIALGDRLGYYRLLADNGPMSASELADVSATAERYAREWLEHQAVAGLLEVDDGGSAAQRRYHLGPGVAEVLADTVHPSHLAPLARQLAAAARQLPVLVRAYRDGTGVPWSTFGEDMRESEGDLNRPAYHHLLADEWLSALPDVQQRLRQSPHPRIADVGCGAGWSCIALAQGYPRAQVDGYELDAPTVQLAQRHAVEAGVADRVRIHQADITQVAPEERYDLVTAFECLHDLPYPVSALTAMRHLVGPDGAVLVADMKVADEFTAPGDEVERLMYGFSVLVCLPDSMSSPDSAATGTVLRADTLRRWVTESGYRGVDILPVEHDLWRFYRLHP